MDPTVVFDKTCSQVMFPNVEAMFRSDIKTMKDFCALAQPEHLVMLKEVEKQFLTEFDFREEAKNLELVRTNMRRAWSKEVSKRCSGTPVCAAARDNYTVRRRS